MTEQVAVVVFRVASVQGDVTKLPVPELVQETDPVGVVAPAPVLSFTVAVQLVAWLMNRVVGVHETVVIVEWVPIVMVELPKLPLAWTVSPP